MITMVTYEKKQKQIHICTKPKPTNKLIMLNF